MHGNKIGCPASVGAFNYKLRSFWNASYDSNIYVPFQTVMFFYAVKHILAALEQHPASYMPVL